MPNPRGNKTGNFKRFGARPLLQILSAKAKYSGTGHSEAGALDHGRHLHFQYQYHE